ncbi:MAG: TcaA NTF2-like domain-containing protein [Bacillaceae bacterium]
MHFTLVNIYSPERVVKSVISSVKDNDTERLNKNLLISQVDNVVDTDVLKGFIQYMTDENDFSVIEKRLLEEVQKVQSLGKSDPILDSEGNKLFQLVKGDKEWLFYQRYFLRVIPIEVTVETNIEGVDIYINKGKKKTITNAQVEEKVGMYIPSIYHVTAEYERKYAKVSKEEKLDFTMAKNNKLSTTMNLEVGTIAINGDNTSGIIYVNGESTGILIDKGQIFGPVATDGTIVIHAEVKEGERIIKSNAIKIEDDSDVYFSFGKPVEPVKQKPVYTFEGLQAFIQKYLYQSVEAINNRDFSRVESLHHPNGKTYKQSKDYLKYLEKKGIKEELLSANLVNFIPTEDGCKVITKEEYTIFYGDGTSKKKNFTSSYIIKPYMNEQDLRMYEMLE